MRANVAAAAVVAAIASLLNGCASLPATQTDAGPAPATGTPAVAPAPASAASDARPSPFPNAPAPPFAPPKGLDAPLAAEVIGSALELRGARYVLGGEDPDSGFDCSGLVQYVFAEHQVALPRTVAEQFHAGAKVSVRRIEPGDLVFFETNGSGPSHVGIALGSTTFVHAPGAGQGVRVEHFDTPYWRRRLLGVRRVIRAAP